MEQKNHIKLTKLLPVLIKLSSKYPNIKVGTDVSDVLSLYGITEKQLHKVFPDNPLKKHRIGSYTVSKEITINLLKGD